MQPLLNRQCVPPLGLRSQCYKQLLRYLYDRALPLIHILSIQLSILQVKLQLLDYGEARHQQFDSTPPRYMQFQSQVHP